MPIFTSEHFIENYTRMGDVATIGICIVVFILLATSYVAHKRAAKIFFVIVGLVFTASILHVGFHQVVNAKLDGVNGLLYSLRLLYQTLLFQVLFLFTLYISVITNMEHSKSRRVAIISAILFAAFTIADIVFTLTGIGFSINRETKEVREGFDIFTIGYFVYIVYITYLLITGRKLVHQRVANGFYSIVALSVIIRIGQLIINQDSLTTLTFALPVIGMLYIVHANPMDINLGTLNSNSLEQMVKNLYDNKKEFIFMSLLLPNFVGEGKSMPDEVKTQTIKFTKELFRNGVLFQINNGQLVLLGRKDSNPDYIQWMNTILKAFEEQYEAFKLPYKIVYGESIDEISESNEYLSFINFIHTYIPENTKHRVDSDDIENFRKRENILKELEDIYHKCDLDDPRVLAYCQPVFNIETGAFDTAEALMRLDLPRNGIVYPDQFIPLAEQYGYIHVLTKIILNKTCQAISQFVTNGYLFKRISVNVSIIELKDERFCTDIEEILKRNNVSGDKLAIEITESKSEDDFYFVKAKIEELHDQGIKFYLDDFGTGYSNMERILELPFDIIKFDRSMVIASGVNARSKLIVSKLATMFKDLDYSVLYEGVESNNDENRCINMSASYLQGFKYSRPIPIGELSQFLMHTN